MPPKLSYGLNIPTKSTGAPSSGQKRKKPILDADSDDEQNGDGAVEISTVGDADEHEPPTQPVSIKQKKEIPNKKKVTLGTGSKPNVKPLNKGSIFADDEAEDEKNGGGEEEGLKLGMNAPKSSSNTTTTNTNTRNEYMNLSALHSSKKHAEEAESLDPSIYSYDTVYDSLHTKPKENEKAKSTEGPRYMTSLLRSAEVRKRDQLRARDRMLAKEREAEGDEFADKEKFVTSAYKAQQEELRNIEEEEKKKEEEEEERRRKNVSGGMVDFYRDVLSRGEKQHQEAIKAAEETAEKVKSGEIPEGDVEKEKGKDKSDAQVAAELNAHGAHIAVNDEGQVVDKRQLLSAGLNVAPKPKPPPSAAHRADARPAAKPRFDPGQQASRAGQRARQTEMIAAQLEEQSRKEEEAEEARQKEIAERSRSRRTEKDVSGAKERYLARKREREAAAGGGS